MKKNDKQWPGCKIKMALLLAFLPFVTLLVSLICTLPLPVFPLNLATGELADYVFFTKNLPNNIADSIFFASFCFVVGMIILIRLTQQRGTLKAVINDLIAAFVSDLNKGLGLGASVKKKCDPTQPTNPTKETPATFITNPLP